VFQLAEEDVLGSIEEKEDVLGSVEENEQVFKSRPIVGADN
jgi:hypothetical protein